MASSHLRKNYLKLMLLLEIRMLYVVFREFPMTGVPFEGLMTDVQAFDRFLTPEEAIAYTTCAQVGCGNYQRNFTQP